MAPTMRKESLTGQLIGVHVAMISLATVTVVSRLMVRWTLTDSGFGGDDIVIIISLLLAGVFVAINLDRASAKVVAETNHGLGKHVADLRLTQHLTMSQELFYFGEVMYYITVGTTKIAVLLLYLRIIPPNKKYYRYVIYSVMVFIALTVFACVVANIFQCTPVDFAWNKNQQGSCINQVALYYSNAGLDIFQDLVIYLLPIRILYQLQLPRKQKIALIAIFVVGGFVCVTGMIRLSSLKTAAVTDDPTWYNVAAANWSAVEICVGIFCASLVHFRPLVSRFAPMLIESVKGTARGSEGTRNSGNRPSSSTWQYARTGQQYDVELLAEPGGPRASDASLPQDRICVKREFYTT